MIENCRHCGKEVEGGTVFCPECRAIVGAKKPKRIWIFSLIFSGLLLSLTGMMLWQGGLSFGNLSLNAILGKPAAVINGEKISRSDLKARLKIVQGNLERQYGKDLFTGDKGRTLFVNLENRVINDMVEERLVSQEARKLGIKVTGEQVKRKVDQITKEVFGTWENFQSRLREEGMSKEDLENNIRHLLLLEALKEAKAPEGGKPDVSFNAWLIQARQKAEVTVYNSENLPGSAPSLAGGCCSPAGSSGGCGGQSAAPRQIDAKIESEAQKAALEAFQKSNPADKNVAAKVTDQGCHIQVDIQKEGRAVKSYTYRDGKVFDNS